MLLRSILDVILPRYCPVCNRRLTHDEEALCLNCNVFLPRTNYSLNPYDNALAKLFWGRIPIEKACSLYYHISKSDTANIIYSIKYHNNPYLGRCMGKLIARNIISRPPKQVDGQGPSPTFFDDIDVMIPVPISSKRQRQRGYNQSHELCKGIKEITSIPILPKAIIRKKFKVSQTKLSRIERAENITDAFELNPKYSDQLVGKHILVVDDIITTGSTTIACAKPLVAVEGIKISILSLAHTKR